MDCSLPRLLCSWDFPGKSTGVGCHFLLQRIFMAQGSNPGLLHCRQMLYHLSHLGSPRNGHMTQFWPKRCEGRSLGTSRKTCLLPSKGRVFLLPLGVSVYIYHTCNQHGPLTSSLRMKLTHREGQKPGK